MEKIKEKILTLKDNSTVLVDESMQPWHSPTFLTDSLLSAREWIQTLFQSRRISVFVIHSWTKLWACTGLRLGSLVCPTLEHLNRIKKRQVPWSVNLPALAFLDSVCRDRAYLEETWKVTTQWRAYAVQSVMELCAERGWRWVCHGEAFLSWVWIDVKSVHVAEKVVSVSRQGGCPVRWVCKFYFFNSY